MNRTLTLVLSIGFTFIGLQTSAFAAGLGNTPTVRGVLDQPLAQPDGVAPVTIQTTTAPTADRPFDAPGRDPALDSPNPDVRQDAVQTAVEEEIEVLETLPMSEVEELAESGERAAQVVLGNEFAREAQSLSNMPVLANQAAEDAIRWYSQAARRGFPGAPSLDYAGVSFYPVRVQRFPNQ